MVKVITYGTFDLLHVGHERLLTRAKALGDYLIVGVTADDFDKARGKINVRQSLMERIEAVKALGIADEVIVEEYEGQKIDDIRNYGIDIFTVGSDWEGQFDYLREYCTVIYLPRTEGVSSTDLRGTFSLKIGLLGESGSELTSIGKFIREAGSVNGAEVLRISSEEEMDACGAVYIASHPSKHCAQVKAALLRGKHVLCESPLALDASETRELYDLAEERGLVLTDGVKTSFATAYMRLLLLVKSGKIGDVLAVDATCTSLKDIGSYTEEDFGKNWNTICEWGPVGLLPVFQIFGTDVRDLRITSRTVPGHSGFDLFTRLELLFERGTASVKLGKGVKSEGELVISGTKGYILVPAPWWKPDYFELRFEDPSENRKFFYPLEGEGIRYEILAFLKAVEKRRIAGREEREFSAAVAAVMETFFEGKKVNYI